MGRIPNLVFSLMFFICIHAIAQQSEDILGENLLKNTGKWNEGSILLNNGTQLFGLLRYDYNTGILSYQSEDDSRTFVARSCAKFEFYNEAQKIDRTFYALPADEKTNIKNFHFYEVLKAFETFAVLSKVDPPEIVKGSIGGDGPVGSNGTYMSTTYITTHINRTETIAFIDEDGTIMPYLKIMRKEIEGVLMYPTTTITKSLFVDEEVLATYTHPHYEQLEAFAIKNNLSFKHRKDLLKILEEYQQLLKK